MFEATGAAHPCKSQDHCPVKRGFRVGGSPTAVFNIIRMSDPGLTVLLQREVQTQVKVIGNPFSGFCLTRKDILKEDGLFNGVCCSVRMRGQSQHHHVLFILQILGFALKMSLNTMAR